MHRHIVTGMLAVGLAAGSASAAAPTAAPSAAPTAASAPAPRQVAYALAAYGSLAAVDVATSTAVPILGFSMPGGQTLWNHQMAVSPDGRRLYAGYTDGSTSYVSVIDTATNQTIDKIAPNAIIRDIVVSPDGKRVYLGDQSGAQVWVVDTTTDTILTSVTGLQHVWAMAISPDGHSLYVATTSTNPSAVIDVVDTTTLTLRTTITVAGHVNFIGVSPDGSRVYAATYPTGAVGGSLTVIDASTDGELEQIPAGGSLMALTVGGDGRVYVCVGSSSTTPAQVKVYSPDAGAFVSAVTFPNLVSDLTLSPDSKTLYASHLSQQGIPEWFTVDVATGTVGAAAYGTAYANALVLANVSVMAPPTASLTVSVSDAKSATVTANAVGRPGFDAIASYRFDFGDGSVISGSSSQASHPYATAGTYQVTVTVTDVAGDTASAKAQVSVEPVSTSAGLRADNSAYVTVLGVPAGAQTAGGFRGGAAITPYRPLIATGTTLDRFDLVVVGTGDVVLRRVSDQQFVRIGSRPQNALVADTGDLGSATVFHLVTNKDGTVAFQVKSTGRYVTSHEGSAPLSADSTTVGAAESFRLVTG